MGFVQGQFEAGGYPTGSKQWSTTSGAVTFRPLGLEKELRLAGLLGNKHIPEEYLNSSTAQRADLLAGLLDSDGTVDIRDNVTFSNKNVNLAEGVARLAASLGHVPTTKEIYSKLNGVEYGPYKKVTWRASSQCFRMPRKADRIIGDGSIETTTRRVDGYRDDSARDLICLTVAGDSSLFCVTENFILTHNCPGPARINQMPDLINAVAYTKPVPPADPNAGRKWKAFAKNVTDKGIYAAGGRNDQVAELQLLLNKLGYLPKFTLGSYFSETVNAWIKFKKDQAKLAPKDPRWKDLTSAVKSDQIASLRWWAGQKK